MYLKLMHDFQQAQNKESAIILTDFFLCYLTEVRGITNRKTVIEGYENVQAALLDYTLTCYPSVTVSWMTFDF